MRATPKTLRDGMARIHARSARTPMTYRVGDYVPAAMVEGAWEMATDVLARKYRSAKG